MWLPILFNFFSTIFTLIGLFGVYYQRPVHLTLFILFQVISLCWNAFVVAFYLEVPPLTRGSDILSLGTGSRSWWESNGPSCQPLYNMSDPSFELIYRPILVQGCLLPFYVVETVQAGIHLLLTLIAFFMSIYQLILFCGKDRLSGECAFVRFLRLFLDASTGLVGDWRLTASPLSLSCLSPFAHPIPPVVLSCPVLSHSSGSPVCRGV